MPGHRFSLSGLLTRLQGKQRSRTGTWQRRPERRSCLFAFLPLSRAHFAVLFVELQGINHAQHLVDVATQRQIVDNLVTNDTVLVDQEGATNATPASGCSTS